MKISISPRPKNEIWPDGHAPATSGTAQDSCLKWTLQGMRNTVSMSKMMNSIATM